jgi:hypothetical protein
MPIDNNEWEARWRYRWAWDLLSPPQRRAIDPYVLDGYDMDLFEADDPHRRHLYTALDKLADHYGRDDYLIEIERKMDEERRRMEAELGGAAAACDTLEATAIVGDDRREMAEELGLTTQPLPRRASPSKNKFRH